jgi:polar amino acid transport system ATP-binding protein
MSSLPQMNGLPLLAADGLTKCYGTNVAISNIDLAVYDRDVVCIIGPSGSGKTTLLRCLALLEQPSEGQVLSAGTALSTTGPLRATRRARDRARGEIGMVFQQFNLWPHMTVLQNLIEAPTRVRKLPRQEATAQATALLAQLGLVDQRDAYPSRLSGGQQQRVAIARALCMKPRVLLFDEPTSALDPELRKEVRLVMQGLAANGMTMIIVTHEMNFARRLCGRMVFMDAGKIVEVGVSQAFFDAPATDRAKRFLARVED